MGKPFIKELQRIPDTIDWAFNQPTIDLTEFLFTNPEVPLFVIGSGGSLSACYFAAYLYQKLGTIAKAITPLDLYYSRMALRNSKLLFISSSGKNKDILFSFNIAIRQEPRSILTMCMAKNAPLSKVASGYSLSKTLEYEIPSRKDGFLATNTLVAYYVLLCKAFEDQSIQASQLATSILYRKKIDSFILKLTPQHSLIVLFGGIGQSIAFDIESKFTEAALINVSLSDYRNFGHGRHHWLSKRETSSAIVALVTPEEHDLAQKTLALIPDTIPKLIIESHINAISSSIDLLLKSFQLVQSFGKSIGIDPGKPGVPEFGRSLYHLNYLKLYNKISNKINSQEELHISRKTGAVSIKDLSPNEQAFWIDKYHSFVNKLRKAQFGSVVFDYDGTLCPSENRFSGLSDEIRFEIIRLLDQKIVVGIATGRGKSVRQALINWIPQHLIENVIIGYYNGSSVGCLNEINIPNKDIEPLPLFINFQRQLMEISTAIPGIKYEIRPYQLTIYIKADLAKPRAYKIIKSIAAKPEFSGLLVLESSHSIDLIKKPEVSKLNILNRCVMKAQFNNKSTQCLCIGDKGNWPGNDFELLSGSYSLSVDEVSADPETCWNLSSLGQRNVETTLEYLKRMTFKNGNVIFS